MAEHLLVMTIVRGDRLLTSRQNMLQDRGLTIQDLSNTLGLSDGTCQRILSEELNMRRIAATFVPRLLHNEQKQLHPTSVSSQR
jgi:hypothetical protein